MPVPVSNSKLTFGLFEVDLESGELWKAGFRVKLQTQPFKVLAALLEHPGQIVTREELQLRLWGRDTVVDFDHSLGTAVNKIREALGDSADSPRYIETLAKRGYRFIAPVNVLHTPSSGIDLADPSQTTNQATEPSSPHGDTAVDHGFIATTGVVPPRTAPRYAQLLRPSRGALSILVLFFAFDSLFAVLAVLIFELQLDAMVEVRFLQHLTQFA